MHVTYSGTGHGRVMNIDLSTDTKKDWFYIRLPYVRARWVNLIDQIVRKFGTKRERLNFWTNYSYDIPDIIGKITRDIITIKEWSNTGVIPSDLLKKDLDEISEITGKLASKAEVNKFGYYLDKRNRRY